MVHLDRALFTSERFPLRSAHNPPLPFFHPSLPSSSRARQSPLLLSPSLSSSSDPYHIPSLLVGPHPPLRSLSGLFSRLLSAHTFRLLSPAVFLAGSRVRVLLASGAQRGRAVRFLLVTRGHHGLARPFVAPMSATSRPRSDTRRTCVLSKVTRFGSTETSGPRPFSPISSLGSPPFPLSSFRGE